MLFRSEKREMEGRVEERMKEMEKRIVEQVREREEERMKEMEGRAKEERREMEERVKELDRRMVERMREETEGMEGKKKEDGDVAITIPPVEYMVHNFSALKDQDKEWRSLHSPRWIQDVHWGAAQWDLVWQGITCIHHVLCDVRCQH